MYLQDRVKSTLYIFVDWTHNQDEDAHDVGDKLISPMTMMVLSLFCKNQKSAIIHTYEIRPHSLHAHDEPCLERANASREGRSRC